MRRWHQDQLHMQNELKTRRKFVDSNHFLQPGRYRKKHALDCGKSTCKVCHSDKFPKRSLTTQELKANISFKEQTWNYH